MMQNQELVTIRVRSLVISPHNVRQTPSRKLKELAASIKHHGVIEPLVVQDVPSKGLKPGYTAVIDGGRRLRALNMLIDAGDLDPEHRVLCTVYTGQAAHEISAAANMHESMHPADEFVAFRNMINAGSTIEEVAARFGTTPATVQRRLKLANVSAPLIQAYRDEKLTLDHLMAFAITDDHKAQDRLWKSLKDKSAWERAPDRIRNALVKPGSIDVSQDKRARFVGLDAYEAAGGAVVRDLFSNGGGFIGDEALLQRLTDEKLQAVAESLRAEGWSWVTIADQWSYSDECAHSKSQPKKRPLTDDETAQLASLRAKAAEIDTRNAALDVEDEDLLEELGQVEAQIEAIEASVETYTDRQKSKAGAVVTITHSGDLKIIRGLIKPETVKKAQGGSAGKSASDDSTGAPEDTGPRPLSENLVAKLTAHRTAALQALVADSPAVALVALLFSLVPQIFSKASTWRARGTAKISVTEQRGTIQRVADDLEGSRAWTSMEASVARWEDRIPDGRSNLFTWLQGLSQADQLDLLAVCVAHTIDTQATREESDVHVRAHELGAAVDLDMADWWEPTAGSYLASVPKSRRMDAVREVAGDAAAERISTMKKDTMIGAAEEYLAGRRWLPAILRDPKAAARPARPSAPAPASSAAPAKSAIKSKAVRYADAAGNTWTGRGKRPAWVEQALKDGKALEALLATESPIATEEA